MASIKLMTEVDLSDIASFKLDYRQRGLIIGSCFAQNIGNKLKNGMMPVVVNPYGVIYNPASIVNAMSCEHLEQTDLVEHGGLWHSMLHHGSFSSSSLEQTLHNVNQYVHGSRAKSYDYAIVTLGTAWVYRMKDSGRVVANCHKMPSRLFDRQRLSLEEVEQCLEQIMDLCPAAKFIFTVSPIRHLKDGLIDNNISKSTLRLAIERVRERYADRIAYFPAYEIMIDQLRDYRFYDKDMTHPSEQAVEYITDAFCEMFFDNSTRELMRRAEKIKKSREHRPLHPDGVEYMKFMEYVNEQVLGLMKDYPDLELSF